MSIKTTALFPYIFALNSEISNLVNQTFPRVLQAKKETRGRVIWHAYQGTMRVRTGPKLTKAEKKAAKKARRSLREAGDA